MREPDGPMIESNHAGDKATVDEWASHWHRGANVLIAGEDVPWVVLTLNFAQPVEVLRAERR